MRTAAEEQRDVLTALLARRLGIDLAEAAKIALAAQQFPDATATGVVAASRQPLSAASDREAREALQAAPAEFPEALS